MAVFAGRKKLTNYREICYTNEADAGTVLPLVSEYRIDDQTSLKHLCESKFVLGSRAE